MKKIYSFVCLVLFVAIVACCFNGCVSNENNEDTQIDTYFSNPATTSSQNNTTNNSQNNTTPVSTESTNIGSTNKVVTNYAGCWIVLPDGRVIRGTVVSWMIVNENLIQVTMKDMKIVGTRDSWCEGEVNTYLVSADRVYFYTD